MRLIVMAASLALGIAVRAAVATASSSEPGFDPAGALDEEVISTQAGHAWKGAVGGSGWWQVDFGKARPIGSIFQVVGDHDFVFTNAPSAYVWQASDDGESWRELPSTRTTHERRLFRMHRLKAAVTARFLRLRIDSVWGVAATLRAVHVLDSPTAIMPGPPWILAVNTTHDSALPGHGQEFIPLARSCPGWARLGAQQVWVGDLDEALVEAEPRPLAMFLSGNFKDWCEVDRGWWRGVEAVLKRGTTPIWASCGGAQGLALLSEYGTRQPWDCPHCRDPRHPKTPLYTHLGHTGTRPCGDYSACVFERGVAAIRPVVNDPVFAGLPPEFLSMESHCGQIAWAPRGWEMVATGGSGSPTHVQCMRWRGRPIYAAQFHIEMAGLPGTAGVVMGNFLQLADEWRSRER